MSILIEKKVEKRGIGGDQDVKLPSFDVISAEECPARLTDLHVL